MVIFLHIFTHVSSKTESVWMKCCELTGGGTKRWATGWRLCSRFLWRMPSYI